MRRSVSKEDSPRLYADRSVQTSSEEDGWLVSVLVFGFRFLLVFFVAFCRAVVILAGENFVDSSIDKDIQAAVLNGLDSIEASQNRTPSATAPPQSPQLERYYVVFIGRDVGYTTNCTLMSSLVQGIPNNSSKRFNSFDEALHAYTMAAYRGNVRRVRTVAQPSGNVEFAYEYMSVDLGIRDLDRPRQPPRPLNPTNTRPDQSSATPCDSETLLDPPDGAGDTTAYDPAPADCSSGRAMPADWALFSARDANADTVIISTATATATTSTGLASIPNAVAIVYSDSDDDLSNSSVLTNNSAMSSISAHSSDIYYTDKQYDKAFAAYIEEEDNNACNVEAGSSATILVIE